MAKLFGMLVVIGCALTAAVVKDSSHPTARGLFKSFEADDSLCPYLVRSKQVRCVREANKIGDPETRQAKIDICNSSAEVAKAQCRRRLFADLSSNQDDPSTFCAIQAFRSDKLCKAKYINEYDAEVRNKGLSECAFLYYKNITGCPQRSLDQLLQTTAQKHKSWCTFKASASRAWCKAKGLRWSQAARRTNYFNCDNAYNLQVAQCAQRRLMNNFEKSIKSGTAHKGWCEFKNRSRWLWCKAANSVNLNATQRRANLAKCDASYNQGYAACKNASLSLNVATNTIPLN